jgi:hypothetical protein
MVDILTQILARNIFIYTTHAVFILGNNNELESYFQNSILKVENYLISV